MLYSCHFDKTELKIIIFINFQVYHRNEKNFESFLESIIMSSVPLLIAGDLISM